MKRGAMTMLLAVCLAAPAVVAESGAKRGAHADDHPKFEQSAEVPKDLRQEVDKLTDRVEKAWNAHDPKAFASTFAKDATLMNPMGRTAVGSKAIEELFRDEHAGMLKGSRANIEVERIQPITPQVAVVDWTHSLTGLPNPERPEWDAHVTAVIVKEAGNWRLSHLRAFEIAEPPEPPEQPRGG